MRSIVELHPGSPPTLRMFIRGAPHRRAHQAILKRYRVDLWEAWNAAGHSHQISESVKLHVTFINPTGPDLDNLLTALFQALDGKTGKGPTILADDRQIWGVEAGYLVT